MKAIGSSLTRWISGIALGLTLSGVAMAAATGIAASKHNLGSSGVSGNNQTSSTGEICVFCHTPHASNTTVGAPLWNKALPSSTYTTYSTANSSTIDGTVNLGSISLACLSCHDGTQAMDNVINKPGSGGYLATGHVLGVAGNWSGSNQSNGLMTGVAALGTDLTNDHPVGIQYCGGGITSAGGSCTDADFKAPASTTINSTKVWWVDTEATGNGTRQKTDMILYGQTLSSSWQPMVECGSCHDPHSTNTTFLRIENTGSAVCLACHNK